MTRAKPGGAVVKRVDPRLRLLGDLREMIAGARRRAAVAVNAELVMLYWRVGKRIREDILGNERADYGKRILHAVCAQLTAKFGPGYTARNVANMIRFAEVFPKEKIVHALCAKLTWSHIREIIYLENPLQRQFYVEMCRIERWSTRTLHERIGSMLFERTALARKPEKVIAKELRSLAKSDEITEELTFRDPYILDFLNLPADYAEKDIEDAIVRELQRFIQEMGSDFAFVARQKRITVDNEDYYLDLLFYHRRLRRLVAIDLKMGQFRAADKGQMELYLRWLEAHEKKNGEKPPIGLILCAGKSDEHVKLLRLGDSGIRVGQYMTELPPRELLERKLHDAIEIARRRVRALPAGEAATQLRNAGNGGERGPEGRG